MEQVLFSTTIFASFLGGIVALLAPCCVSVMLPAFFASSFRRRSQLLGMTLVFAAGVGTIILPIALGAAAISRLLIEYHLWVFGLAGIAMILGGVATFAGWKMMLPMPSGPRASRGIASVYGLGVFSGVASACCAPVLAGVAALSGATSSLPAAAVVGVAYVFGMVAPLSALALVWDKKDWGNSRLLRSGSVPLWPGARRRVPFATFLAGSLMVAMGILTMILAIQGPGMAPDGWQVEVTAFLNHAASVVIDAVAVIPGWLLTGLVFAALAGLVWGALRARRSRRDSRTATAEAIACEACEPPRSTVASEPDEAAARSTSAHPTPKENQP